MPKTDRRTFLQVLAGAAGFGSGLATHEAAESDGGAVAVVAAPDEPTESLSSAVTAASGLYEEFRVEADPANLPEPDDRPALALTNAGIYEWTEATPSWTQTNILTGTAANKLPPLYSEALTTDETNTDRVVYDYSQWNPNSPTQPQTDAPIPKLRDHPQADNPVIVGSDTTPSGASGIADPFVVHDSGIYYMFVEVLASDNNHINYLTSDDGISWTDQGTVLDPAVGDSGWSYPYVRKVDGDWLMTPTNHDDRGNVYIYKPDTFPGTNWTQAEKFSPPNRTKFEDTTPIRFNDRWYLITTDTSTGTGPNDREIALYYADKGNSLTGRSWTEHSSSPILSSANGPCGTPLERESYIDLPFAYTADPTQGVRMYRITDLTTSSFSMTETSTSPILQANENEDNQWRAGNPHHADWVEPRNGQRLWVCDGQNDSGSWKIGAFLEADGPTYKAQAYLSSNQTLSSGTSHSELDIDTRAYDEYYDTIDLSANEITVPNNGWYEIGITATLQSPSGTDFFFSATVADKGGTFGTVVQDKQTVSTQETVVIGKSNERYLDAGTVLIPKVAQNRGGDETVLSGRHLSNVTVRQVA